MDDLPGVQLPQSELTERADAASNRRKILAAAAQLFQERGAANVSMQDVARAACVGMGTMYRRFGDRAGLTHAVLDADHVDFQEQILRGAPPLGPGAPPRERLHAFGRGYLAILDRHAETLAAAKAQPATGGPDAAYRFHLGLLLRDVVAPTVDVDYAVDSLLAAFDPRLHLIQRQERGWPLARVQDGWCRLLDGWIAVPTSAEAGAGR